MKHILKRTASWLLAAALVLTSFYLPGGKIKQASAAGKSVTVESDISASSVKDYFSKGYDVTVKVDNTNINHLQDYINAQLDKGALDGTTLTFSLTEDIDLSKYVNPGSKTNVWESLYAVNDAYTDEEAETLEKLGSQSGTGVRKGLNSRVHTGLGLKLESGKKDGTKIQIKNLNVGSGYYDIPGNYFEGEDPKGLAASKAYPNAGEWYSGYGFFGNIEGYDSVDVSGLDFANAKVGEVGTKSNRRGVAVFSPNIYAKNIKINNVSVSDSNVVNEFFRGSTLFAHSIGEASGTDTVTISNVNFTNDTLTSAQEGVGTAGLLASEITGGKVSLSDISVAGSTLNGESGIGLIAGTATSAETGTIENVSSDADSSVIANGQLTGGYFRDAGGLFGSLDNFSLKNVSNRASVSAASGSDGKGMFLYVGGIAGEIKNAKSIDGASNSGDIKSPAGTNVGGISGSIESKDGNATVTGVDNSGKISGRENAGGIFGTASGVDIVDKSGDSAESKVTNTGKITGTDGGTAIGGIAGTLEKDSSIAGADNSGDVAAGGCSNVGGIVGNNSGTVTGSSTGSDVNVDGDQSVGGNVGYNQADGTVSGDASGASVYGNKYVGGNVGKNDGKVEDSRNTGSITGNGNSSEDVGGNVGWNTEKADTSDSVNSGNVKGGKNVGGNVGLNDGTATNNKNNGDITGKDNVGGNVGDNSKTGTVTNPENSGDVSGTGDNVGGNVGLNDGTVSGTSTNKGDVKGDEGVGGNIGNNTGNADDLVTSKDSEVTGNKDTGDNVGKNTGTVGSEKTEDFKPAEDPDKSGSASGDAAKGGSDQQTSGDASKGSSDQQTSGDASKGSSDQQTSGDATKGSSDQQTSGDASKGSSDQQTSGDASKGNSDQQTSGDATKGSSDQQTSGDATKGSSDQQTSGDATKGGSDQSGSDQGNAGTGNNPSVNPTDAGSDSSKGGSGQQGSGTDAGKGGQSTNPADAGSQGDSDQGTPTAGTSGKTGNQTGADSGDLTKGENGNTNTSGSTNTTNNYYSTVENSELHGWEYTSADATAALNTVELTVDPANSGSINFVKFSGDRKTITVNAVPAQGYSFVSWTVDGKVLKDGADNFNFDSSVVKSVKATFAPSAKVGDVFTVDNYVYQIKTLPNPAASADGTVKVLRNTSNKITSIVVADTVNYLSRTYRVNEIAPKAFTKYTSATSAVIGKYVVTVGNSAFKGDSKLKSVKFNSTELKTIGSSAFRDCKKLKSVSVKSGKLTRIGSSAFRNDKALKTVTIKSKKLKTISGSAFRNATKLKKVTLKSTKLKTISSKAFYGDKKLKTVSIKSSKLKKIGSRAFYKTKVKAFKSVPKKNKAKYAALLAKAKK